MSGIRLDTLFTNTALPVGESLAAGLLASGTLQHWFQADAAHVDLTGDTIDSWADRAGSGRVLTPLGGGATLAERLAPFRRRSSTMRMAIPTACPGQTCPGPAPGRLRWWRGSMI